MQSPEKWSLLDTVESIDQVIESGRWVLPASHLLAGETPVAAAQRIAQEQLQASSNDLRDSSIFSHPRTMAGRKLAIHRELSSSSKRKSNWRARQPGSTNSGGSSGDPSITTFSLAVTAIS